ncbi:MAG: adenosylcobinamide amidohydrolase [Kutzneria sp.]|nr:adenosylcobinamide amidohydrolase [Kutzneria sp.]
MSTWRRAGDPAVTVVDGAPVLVWRCERPWLAVSSAPHGGGIGERHWVLNATVSVDYDRDDPDQHVTEIAAAAGLLGVGTGLLTAVDVRRVRSTCDSGVVASVTTGLGGRPTWAAAPAAMCEPTAIGTINTVCWLPARLSDGALINAVVTATEAKAQALVEVGVPGTGTCTDAVVLLCPTTGPAEPYGGPRSRIGSAVARAVHAAVAAGLR